MNSMIGRFCVWLTFLLALSARGESFQLETLKVGSTTYSNVLIIGANATDLYFKHSQGLANVKLKYVSPALQKRFEYNPKAAEEVEKRRATDDLLYEKALARAQTSPAGNARATPNGSLGADTGLSDPISEKSLLGKASPKLEVDKWLGDKPALEGKFALLSFWAPWSTPCRQWIPQLNALQKKYNDKLVVVGISAGPEAAMAEMAEPHPDFVSGLDAKSKLSGVAGITSIPCVMLCDTNGTVLYQGHPAALTEQRLEAILGKP